MVRKEHKYFISLATNKNENNKIQIWDFHISNHKYIHYPLAQCLKKELKKITENSSLSTAEELWLMFAIELEFGIEGPRKLWQKKHNAVTGGESLTRMCAAKQH